MSDVNRVGKVLFTQELKNELDSKIDKNTGTISWSRVTDKPQLSDGSWKSPVHFPADSPLIDNADGDVRLTLDEGMVFRWVENLQQWLLIGASTMSIVWDSIEAKPETFTPS